MRREDPPNRSTVFANLLKILVALICVAAAGATAMTAPHRPAANRAKRPLFFARKGASIRGPKGFSGVAFDLFFIHESIEYRKQERSVTAAFGANELCLLHRGERAF